MLPPNFPGYKPYCPYTKNPGEKWSAPDMAKAQQLVDASGTKGQKVTRDLDAGRDDQGDRPLLRLAAEPARLQGRAQDAQLVGAVPLRAGLAQQGADQLLVLVSRLHGGVELPTTVVGCAGFHPASTASPNLSEFCDPAIQAKTEQALKLAADRPGRGQRAVGRDRQARHGPGAAGAAVRANRLDFVSKRVGNYQFNPSVTGNFMIDQAWVK